MPSSAPGPVILRPMPGSRTSDYDFDLPEQLVAQTPLARRDASGAWATRCSGRSKS